MRAIKHAILSLLRKPAKAVMIFVIISVVYGLVFTGIIIQNSVKSSKEYVRKELGAVVSMTADAVKVINQRMTGAEFKRLELPVSVANEIAKDPVVKELFITQTANVSNADLKSAVDMGNENGGGFTLRMNRDGQDGSSFTLVGCSSDTPLEFYNGTYQITQGHLRSSADASKDTLIVSDEFASMNNLSVGSLVKLANQNGDSYTFEVIGTFSGSETYMVDQMYSSLDSVYKLSGIQAGAESASSISFLLNDPLDVDQFISRHEAELPNDYLVLDANDSEYESLTRPLDLISTITSILLVVVFIAGALIMLAIITIFVRDRRNEIGLLLSSGEGRIKIVLQFILEILMVSVLSFLLAAGTSRFSSDYVADWIVKNQLVEDNTDSSMNMAGGIRIGRIGGQAVTADNQIQISDVADEFNVEIDGGVVVRLLLLSFGLVILSAGAPLMIILGYKPRESLQD